MAKLFEKADRSRLEGDEETSYVYYMKAMNLVTKIQKRPNYMNEKSVVAKTVGTNATMNQRFKNMSTLQESLVQRYRETYPAENGATPLAESTRVPAESDISQNISEINSEILDVRQTIECTQLFRMMEEGHKLLIMDCRPEEDYKQSKIIYQYTLNVPDKLLTLGMTASKIQQLLPNESKVFWEMRSSRLTLVFVDWTSTRFNRNSPVWHLNEILMEWDPELEKKPEMLLLEGGYEKWKTIYPMKCVNPQYQSPKGASGDMPGLEGIEYPNIDDIQMKDDSFKPQVDRTMKLSALQAHENRKSTLELLEAKTKLVDKSLQNERELLNLETEIKSIITDKENNKESSQKEQSLMFQIWQLQSKQNDSKVVERSLDQQIVETKQDVKDLTGQTKMAQVEEELAKKQSEWQKLQGEREIKHRQREEELKKTRDEALRLAREQKPENFDNRTLKTQRKEELILSPKSLNNVILPSAPTFDRSVKPLINTRYTFNEEDFSPVYGRVVSFWGMWANMKFSI